MIKLTETVGEVSNIIEFETFDQLMEYQGKAIRNEPQPLKDKGALVTLNNVTYIFYDEEKDGYFIERENHLETLYFDASDVIITKGGVYEP